MTRQAVFYENGEFDNGDPVALIWRIASTSIGITLSALDQIVLVDATSASVTIALPAVASVPPGTWYAVKKTDATGHAVTVNPDGSETIDGNTTVQISVQHTTITIVSDGSQWHIV